MNSILTLKDDIIRVSNELSIEALKKLKVRLKILIQDGENPEICKSHRLRCTNLFIESLKVNVKLDRLDIPFKEIPWIDSLIMIFTESLSNNKGVHYYSIEEKDAKEIKNIFQTKNDLSKLINYDIFIENKLIEFKNNEFHPTVKLEVLFPNVFKNIALVKPPSKKNNIN